MNNLPPVSTSFVGRQAELSEIAHLLADPACRLLTLVGPGGIGKTRLAVESAKLQQDAFSNGVYLISLQPLASPDFIIPAIAEALHFQFYPGGEPKQQLLDYLREKSLLLVLDNFEHLLDGVGLVSDILASAPAVYMLATSRERLNLVEEWALDVAGLPVPASESEIEIGDYGAVQLFLQSAERVHVGFTLTHSQKPAITRICRLVGGIPLAIELAAAWVRALSCEEIAGELGRSLDILETSARNMPPRHRNMRTAFEPTWQRLSKEERNVFKRLSVFRGGFTREAAEAVAGASRHTLSALVDKSLLRINDANGSYDVHELLRQYGEEQLNVSAEESERAHDRHCMYYAEFVHQCWEEMLGPQMKAALDAVGEALENAHAAWAWAVSRLRHEELWKFISGLQQFYWVRGRFLDAVISYAQASNQIESGESQHENTVLLACILANHAFFCGNAGSNEQSDKSHGRSLALLRGLDDIGARRETVEALTMLAWTSRELRPLEAKYLCQESIERASKHGYLRELEWALIVLASIDLWILDDYDEGKQAAEQALPLVRQFEHPMGMACCCWFLGQVAYHNRQYAEAKRFQQESYRIFQDLDAKGTILTSVFFLGEIAVGEKDYREARRFLREAIIIARDTYSFLGLQIPLVGIANLLAREGDREKAVELTVLVLDQPDFMGFNPKGKATRLLQNLEADLPPDVFAAAMERGKARKLEETVNELLAELSVPERDAAKSHSVSTGQALYDPLTERELEVLHLMAEGMSNRGIAEQLILSVGTVKWYVSQICSKLQAQNRVQAITKARELNLLL
jgi:predicted ATPase/DNA-binding CsgD family transcriptional regulator